MHLKKLTLENICQHRDVEVEFGSGLNVLLGPNGTGKTNVVAAIELLLCGASAADRTLEEFVTWGESSGTAEMQFALGELEGKARRTISISEAGRCSSNTDLELDGSEITYDQLYEHLGSSAGMIQGSVFAHQKEIGAMLFGQDAARVDFFQRLLNLEAAKRGRRVLRDALGDLDESDSREQLENAKETESVNRSQLNRLRAQLEEIEIPETESKQQLQQTVTKWETGQERLPKARAELKEIDPQETEAKFQQAEMAAQQAKSEAERIGQFEEDLTSVVQLYQSQAQDRQRRVAAQSRVQKIPQTLSGLQTDPPTELQQRAEELEQEIFEVFQQHERQKQLLAVAQSGQTGRCPTCYQTIPTLPDDVSEQQRDALAAKLQELQTEQKQVREQISQRNSQIQQSNQLNQELAQAQSDLQETEGLVEQQRRDQAQNALNSLSSMRERHQTQSQNAQNLQRSLEKEKSRQQALQAEIEQLESLSEEQYNAARIELESIRSAENRRSKLEGQIEQRQESLEESQDRVSTLEIQIEEEAKRRDYKSTLEEAYEHLHRDNLPQRAMRSCVDSINTALGRTLDRFTVDFSAWLDEDLSPRFMKPEHDCSHGGSALSSGEQTAFGVCFHVALWEAFLEKCQLLTLDEPTDSQDAERRQALIEVMEEVRVWANQADRQVLVVTHSSQLAAVADRKIRV